MKIRSVAANNRSRAFEVTTRGGEYTFPYARLRLRPSRKNRVTEVFPDPDLGKEAFTYVLEGGQEDSVHLDAVLDYNRDPAYLKDLLLYRLTIEARQRVEASALSRREIIRRLGTSASQFYRLLDPANASKSMGQLVALLDTLDCDVEVVVKPRKRHSA